MTPSLVGTRFAHLALARAAVMVSVPRSRDVRCRLAAPDGRNVPNAQDPVRPCSIVISAPGSSPPKHRLLKEVYASCSARTPSASTDRTLRSAVSSWLSGIPNALEGVPEAGPCPIR